MEGTIAEIRMFGGTFAPQSWAFCDGSLLPIFMYTPLFALIGTTYGGDGQSTFALPDLRCRQPVGTGQGPGLGNVVEGEAAGVETATILQSNLPPHTHLLNVNNGAANAPAPAGAVLAAGDGERFHTGTPGQAMGTLGPSGSTQALPLRNPYLGVQYIICLEGIFPSRN